MGKRYASFLVCVAAEEDMRTFFRHAADAIAEKCDAAAGLAALDGAGSVEEMYRALYPALVEHAAAIFDGTPAEPAGASTGYRYFGGEYIDEIAPGNTAASGLFSVYSGNYYVLRLCLETAQPLVHESVDAFFETLGSGLYGVALLEAASEDHFKNVAFLCGKHRGAAPLFGLGDPYLNERYTCENLDSLMNLTYETDSWVEEDFEGSEDDEYFDEDAYMDEIRDEVSPFDPNWPDCSMGQCDMIAASVAAVR